MRIRLALPDDIVGPATIAAALEASTVANEALAKRGSLPDLDRAIRDGHVVWKPEPFLDGEHFDLAPEVLRRGWGDCDDLAPWLAAQLRHEGEDARAVAIRSGPTRYHAVVEREDGQILDPSRWAGMGAKSDKRVSGQIYGQISPPGWNSMALIPHSNGWGARADLAWDGDDQIASAAWDRDPKRALSRAVAGLCAACEGFDIAGDDVGSFLSDVVSTVAPVAAAATGNPTGLLSSALPLASSVLSAVKGGGGGGGGVAPGGGGAPVTMPVQSPAGTPSHNRGGGNLTYVPGGGPIIVRF
jgi:hypothetical protein